MSEPRTYTLAGWTADAVRLLRAAPRLMAIYGRSRVDAATRERVMVAVSRANECVACTRVHEAWARRAGVSPEELRLLGAGELSGLPARQRAEITYATALAASGFGAVPADVDVLVNDQLTAARRRDIAAIARLMTFANLTANSWRAAAPAVRSSVS